MDEFLQVFTTAGSEEEAEKLSAALVEKRLAGCVQVFPIKSTYTWKGEVEKAEEWLCIIKTKAHLYNELELAIKSLHSYETPEIVAVPITKGSGDYLEWLLEVTG